MNQICIKIVLKEPVLYSYQRVGIFLEIESRCEYPVPKTRLNEGLLLALWTSTEFGLFRVDYQGLQPNFFNPVEFWSTNFPYLKITIFDF
jgi:hypothetical protein